MKIFGKDFNNNKIKKIVYTAIVVALVSWFVFRFVMVAIENRMQVFNPVRNNQENGFLVESVVANFQDGIIKVPLAVKNNRAYVSPSRLRKFKAGQKIGSGRIISVSNTIDLDSGMYVVKTTGVPDGVNYAEIKMNCVFVPVYAVRNGKIFVADKFIASSRAVKIATQDSENVCITSGVNNGDIILLSNVVDGQKINIK